MDKLIFDFAKEGHDLCMMVEEDGSDRKDTIYWPTKTATTREI
jgi:hypothetical protein